MIELKDKYIEKPVKYGSCPVDYVKIGDAEESFKIFIGENVLNKIKSFLAGDITKELGGVLLGEMYVDDSRDEFIVVDEIVIARYTEADVTRLTFTHKSWEDINDTIDKNYTAKRVLGWFHSHPGHTAFLSHHDKFIHENFFSKEFMVAYVFDPVNNEDGFFMWKNNLLTKAESYFIYKDCKIDNNNINIPESSMEKEKKTKVYGRPLLIILLVISLLSLTLSAALFLKYFELKKEISDVNDIEKRIKELKADNDKINVKLDNFISGFRNYSDTNVADVKNNVKHQIKPGDTLRKLAVLYYQDEGKYNLLIRHNNLKDENDISVGQIIEIPMEK